MIIDDEEDEGDDDVIADESKPALKYDESRAADLSPVDEKEKLQRTLSKTSCGTRSPDNDIESSPLSDKKPTNLVKCETPSSSPKSVTTYSMVQNNEPAPIQALGTKIPISPTMQQPPVSVAMPTHDKINTIPSQSQEPPAKIPRREMRLDESAIARHQQMRYLELLSRLFPEQKRGVIELILKGCNGDIVQAIECILPSHERAVAQMSVMPGQSFTLPPAAVEESSRQRFNASEKHSVPMSAFMPFNTHHGQHTTGHSHGYSMVSIPPCPPGCTCQMSQKCQCPECVQSNASKMPHLKKHDVNGPQDVHSPSSIVTTSFSDIGISPKEALGEYEEFATFLEKKNDNNNNSNMTLNWSSFI